LQPVHGLVSHKFSEANATPRLSSERLRSARFKNDLRLPTLQYQSATVLAGYERGPVLLWTFFDPPTKNRLSESVRTVLNQFAKSCSIVIFHRTQYRAQMAAKDFYFLGNFVESLRNFFVSAGFQTEAFGKAPTN
jgi:hypothetical protein